MTERQDRLSEGVGGAAIMRIHRKDLWKPVAIEVAGGQFREAVADHDGRNRGGLERIDRERNGAIQAVHGDQPARGEASHRDKHDLGVAVLVQVDHDRLADGGHEPAPRAEREFQQGLGRGQRRCRHVGLRAVRPEVRHTS